MNYRKQKSPREILNGQGGIFSVHCLQMVFSFVHPFDVWSSRLVAKLWHEVVPGSLTRVERLSVSCVHGPHGQYRRLLELCPHIQILRGLELLEQCLSLVNKKIKKQKIKKQKQK